MDKIIQKVKPGSLSSLLHDLKENGLRRCCRCKEIKSLDDFSILHQSLPYPYCYECKTISQIRSSRKLIFLRKFNLSQVEYDQLMKASKGLCAICKNPETHRNAYSGKVQELTIDHCHKKGNIRGIVCRNCNLMLGNSKDSIKTLRSAIRYLKRFKN